MGNDKDFWFNRGQQLYDNRDYEAALEAYKRAVELERCTEGLSYGIL